MISLSGFIAFVRSSMGITVADVPDNSPSLSTSYGAAVEWVNQDINMALPNLYEVAVYNLAASFMINWGTEQIFSDKRNLLGLNTLSVGVIQSSSDESTSQSRMVPDFFSSLSLTDLQMLRDPWGRAYMMIAQQFGSLWGLS